MGYRVPFPNVKDDDRLDFPMLLTILLLAFALSMDAFAVSITNGLCYREMSPAKNALYSGSAFGLFQGLMPLIGYFVGQAFAGFVHNVDHWIALILLGFIGGRMAWGAVRDILHPEAAVCSVFSTRTLLVQAVATSIDALAVGVSLAMVGTNIFAAVAIIACITFLFSFCGVFIGHRFGGALGDKATLLGGIILISIGIRVFIDHIIH